MAKKKKRKLLNAVLVPGLSVAQFVVQQLLNGIEVQVEIEGIRCFGYVHKLDFSKDSDYVFAGVAIEDPKDEENTIYLRVSIHTDGTVNIMPSQPEEN
jgi:hypothetical protein